jgi:long-chain acyl-CoA synthetase
MTTTTTLVSPLRRAVHVGADRPSVTCGDERLTYADTWERCRRLADALYGLGLERGDRVAIVGANCHRYLELYMGVPAAGLVVVPLNARHTESELRYALKDSGTRVLFTHLDASGLRDTVAHVFDMGEEYETLLASAEPADLPEDVDETDLAGLFYTGGTTGASKGVMLTHRNLVANAMHYGMCWSFGPDTRWLVIAPLFHAAGSIAVLSTVWSAGQHVVLPAFDPARALDLIEEHRINATLVVPTMLAAMTDEQFRNPRDVSSLEHLAHGGSPIATETLRRAHEAFPNTHLMHLYGATETAPIATTLPNEELLLDRPQARSCGQPAVGVDVIVVDGDGARVPVGEVGEVSIRGANVMAGYWNKPAETAAALIDGWYRTGDLGYQDGEGYLFLVDRAKDMIVSGGENVYCSEVEEALYRHPAVEEAAVFGIPDPRWGEAVHAVVIPRSEVTAEELIAHCRGLIADYKVPKAIDVRDEPLPKSGAGKVLKRELRAPYWDNNEVQVGAT